MNTSNYPNPSSHHSISFGAMVPTFGVMVPGRPIIQFQQTSQTQCVAVLDDPANASEISFFLMPGMTLPSEYGAVLYYSANSFDAWELIGGIGNGRQSGTWRAAWKGRLQDNNPIRLGVSLEPLELLQNMDIAKTGVEDRLEYAKKIALDLFNYMTSFSQTNQPGLITVPTRIFDDWMSRFARKFAIDQNFFLHS